MNTHTSNHNPISPRLISYITAGGIGGIAGGLVFGMMMSMMGMLPMIAGMIGSESPVIGFALHMVISVAFGLLAGGLSAFIPAQTLGQRIIFAIGLGVALWIIGPLTTMPLMMGQPIFQIGQVAMMSLMGHIIYAMITVFTAKAFLPYLASKTA